MENYERLKLVKRVLKLEVGSFIDFEFPGKKEMVLFRASMAQYPHGKVISIRRITDKTARAMRVY